MKEVRKIKKLIQRLTPFLLVAILMVVFALTTDYFFEAQNINSLLRDSAILGILAIGITFIMLSGELDMSVGSIMGIVMIAEARLMMSLHTTAIVTLFLGIAVGIGCGLFNGIIINKLHINSFIATLSTQMFFRGIVYLLFFKDERGSIVNVALKNRVFMGFGGTVGGVYWCAIVWIILVVISALVLRRTKFGTYVYACGSNLNSAKLSGINVTKNKYMVYIISGACAALSGTYLLAWQGATTMAGGNGYEFNAIVAYIVGGAALAGGIGDTVGTAAGALFMTMIVNGIYKYGISSEYQYIVQGVIIIVVSSFALIKNTIVSYMTRKKLYRRAVESEGGENE